MAQKYTKYCTKEVLLECLTAQPKQEHQIHILLNVFKKVLNWLELIYDHASLYHAIDCLRHSVGPIQDEIRWVYIIQGTIVFHQISYSTDETLSFSEYQSKEQYLAFDQLGIYAYLSAENLKQIQHKFTIKEKQKKIRMIKTTLFGEQYLQDKFVREFVYLTKTKQLKSNALFQWDPQLQSPIAIIYKGSISIEYAWKRNIQICELTAGFCIAKNIQQIATNGSFCMKEAIANDSASFSFKLISRSETTTLIIFEKSVLEESPYNVNKTFFINLIQQYREYEQRLQKIISENVYKRIYRNKRSIQSEIKKRQAKELTKEKLILDINCLYYKPTPILRNFSTIQIGTAAQDFCLQLPTHKHYSPRKELYPVSAFTFQKNKPRSQTLVLKTQPDSSKNNIFSIQDSLPSKHRKVKSFSTMKTLTTFRPENRKIIESTPEEKSPKIQFFVPNQFVSRKLKIKYEHLIEKMRNFPVTLKKQSFEEDNSLSLREKMQKLQDYVNSKRIVKMKQPKKKMLFRDTTIKPF